MKIKVGINGAVVQEFVLRSEHYSEVKIKRGSVYNGKPENWTVQITDESFAKGGDTLATIEGTVEEAQDFARKVLDALDKLAEARQAEHQAKTAARRIISDHNTAEAKRKGYRRSW